MTSLPPHVRPSKSICYFLLLGARDSQWNRVLSKLLNATSDGFSRYPLPWR